MSAALRLEGFRSGVSRQAHRLLLDRLIQRYASPSAQRLLHVGGTVHLETHDALGALLDEPDLDEGIRAAFEERSADLSARLARTPGRRVRPPYYDIERASARFLYELVRTLRPSLIVETGVANGISTFFLASALLDNGFGSLCSFEVRPDVAPFLSERERTVWELVVLPERGRRRALEQALDDLGPLDLFLHDSHHTYGWQLAEYELAWPRLRPGGVLASDDVDASFAFVTFCERLGLQAEFLFDQRKFLGATRAGS